MGIVTVEKLENADKDADALEKFISGSDTENVKTRKAKEYPTLANAVRQVIETGGFEPFSTEVELLASTPILEKKAAKALDTKKVWLWDGTQWNDTGLSEYDLANNQRKELIEKTPTTSSQFVNELGFVCAEITPDGIFANNAKIQDIESERVCADNIEISESTIVKSDSDFEIINALGFCLFSPENKTEETTSSPINASDILIGDLVAWENEDLVLHIPQLLTKRTEQIKQQSLIATATSLDPQKAYITSGTLNLHINSSSLGSSFEIAFYDHVSNLNYKTTVDRCAVARIGDNETLKVLMIGDSITNRGGADIISQNLAAHGYTATMLGTINGTKYNGTNPNTEDGLLSEAREGSQIQHLIYALTSRSVINVGDESKYLAMTKADKQSKNPFVRVATSQDDADMVFNGHIFDMRFYLDRFGLSDPDVVYINMGTNDITAYDDKTTFVTLVNAIKRISILIKQTRQALPEAGIVIALPTIAVDQGVYDDRWEKKQVVAIRTLISTIKSLNDTKVYLCPEWAIMSAISGFAYTNNVVSDAIHPLFSGRFTKYNAASAYIVAAHLGV